MEKRTPQSAVSNGEWSKVFVEIQFMRWVLTKMCEKYQIFQLFLKVTQTQDSRNAAEAGILAAF